MGFGEIFVPAIGTDTVSDLDGRMKNSILDPVTVDFMTFAPRADGQEMSRLRYDSLDRNPCFKTICAIWILVALFQRRLVIN
jgi:hypothetical protein